MMATAALAMLSKPYRMLSATYLQAPAEPGPEAGTTPEDPNAEHLTRDG